MQRNKVSRTALAPAPPFTTCPKKIPVSGAALRPPPPPDVAGAPFAKDIKEVRLPGGRDSTKRIATETESAKFWSDFSYTISPPGRWNDTARQLATRLSLTESARLLALLNPALADAGIACWECKDHYNFRRPVTAIQVGGDKACQPLLDTPPHPEHVSGHSAFSGAAINEVRRRSADFR